MQIDATNGIEATPKQPENKIETDVPAGELVIAYTVNASMNLELAQEFSHVDGEVF